MMERLTYRGENGKGYVVSEYHGSKSTERKRAMVADRLTAYEDTGLEPEEIVSLANGTLKDATVDVGSDLYRLAIERAFEKIYGTTIEHVCALLAAENDGQLMALPFVAMVEQSLQDGHMRPQRDQGFNGRYAVIYSGKGKWGCPLIDICGTPYNSGQAEERKAALIKAKAALEGADDGES